MTRDSRNHHFEPSFLLVKCFDPEALTNSTFTMTFSGPTQLGAVILAARLMLGDGFFSDPTQLGGVMSAFRLQLGCVIVALTLLHTVVQRDSCSGPTKPGSRGFSGHTPTRARALSAGTATHDGSACFFQRPDESQSRAFSVDTVTHGSSA